ncbi:MAG: type VI secretion system baseplate subunit TssF [Burkholderiales bacterium]|nr:MAG: type VI secretion system baseplate subunit TssF [Burkholderiales bacterium]
MHPKLLDYYSRELAHVREMGAEFAREFPKIAARLGIEGLEVADPYVERLLEGFAFVAARVQLRLDAEFPRFTQQLIEIVYPHYLRPTPSFGIVAFEPKAKEQALSEGVKLARGALLRSVVPRGEQTACEFRTAHEVTLWPIAIADVRYFRHAPDLPLAQIGTERPVRAGLRVKLRCSGPKPFAQLACDTLDFHVAGADDVAGPLLEAIGARCVAALVVTAGNPAQLRANLGPQRVEQIGFDDEQSLLPAGRRSFQGYRLLHEFFAFPQRYAFVRIGGLQQALRRIDAHECELVLLFDELHERLEGVVAAENLVLYATPVVNLLARRADRVPIDEGRFEHQVVIDRTRPLDFEVFELTDVHGIGADGQPDVEFLPFFAAPDEPERSSERQAFYTVRREPRRISTRQQQTGTRTGYVGSEVFLSLVDARDRPYPPGLRQLAVQVVATNRDLPLLLPIAASNPLTLAQDAPVEGVRLLRGPTRPRPGLVEGDFAWRLLSHLSLNYMSLFDEGGDHGVRALRDLLRLYAELADPAQRRQVDGVVGVSARPLIRRLPHRGPIAFGRGLEVALSVDESAYAGAGGFLLGAVLERFFARHVSINSFTQTSLQSAERGEIARWPPRTGLRPIA